MTHKKWLLPSDTELDPDLYHAVGGHPLVTRILLQRGIDTPAKAQAFLDPALYPPAPPEHLPDLVTAAEYIDAAIGSHQKILIWGDFDVDGQTATSLLLDALQQLGSNVAFYIPNRLRESHGILVDSLRQQMAMHKPSVLLTCDTGISAHEALHYAVENGIVALVTDHHDLPSALPNAHALVNPKRLPAGHALSTLPGVGVAYKLVEYLYTQRGQADQLTQFLDLVALGIVADVAEQVHDTRYLLQIGLSHLQRTQRIGLQALMDVAGIQRDQLDAADIGFQIGPRLNAAGRLADASLAVELLTTQDSTRANVLALQLEGLNNQRRLENKQIYAAAQDQIARDDTLLDWEALVLTSPTWHPGIMGIVASRLAERYQRPVVLLNTADDLLARGSARSAPGYDIGAAIAAQSDLLVQYGGHPGAAGLALHPDNIPAFRRRLSNTLRDAYDPSTQSGLAVNASLALPEVNLELVRELNRLAPFGEGNPPITVMSTELRLKSAAYLGRGREHRRLTVEDAAGHRQTVIWWSSADMPLPEGIFDLAYEPAIRMYKDAPELQLVLVDYRPSPSVPQLVETPQRKIIDCRFSNNPADRLSTLLGDYPASAVWAEGYVRSESPGIPLAALPIAECLIIYTTPACPQRLYEALDRVKPSCVVLLAVDPPLTEVSDIQTRLLSLIKYILNRQNGRTTLDILAGALGQSPEMVRLLLEFYAARGDIRVETRRGDSIVIHQGERQEVSDISERMAAIQDSLAETRAYRAFFKRANPYQLLGWNQQ